jgi:hypothetical protein
MEEVVITGERVNHSQPVEIGERTINIGYSPEPEARDLELEEIVVTADAPENELAEVVVTAEPRWTGDCSNCHAPSATDLLNTAQQEQNEILMTHEPGDGDMGCPNGRTPSRVNNPNTGRYMRSGMQGGFIVGAIFGAATIFLNVVGFPEVEAYEAVTAGTAYGEAYGFAAGTAGALYLTPPVCPGN